MELGFGRMHTLVWFFNEKTVSSGFKALIPNPLGRYKYQQPVTQPHTTQLNSLGPARRA
jgi:hypothetical protein